MENKEYSARDFWDWFMFWLMLLTMASSLKAMPPTDKEMLAKILGHQPTKENLEDLEAIRKEIEAQKNTQQREIDREKLRHYIFGWDIF